MIALSGGSTAFADNAIADGDNAVPIATNTLDLGTVCVGDTTGSADNVLLGVSRNGSSYPSTNVFKKGTSVTFSVVTTSTAALTATMDSATVTLPDNWDELDNNVIAGTATSAVVLSAPTSATSFVGSITYRATGTSSKDDSTLTRDTTMAVTADVSDSGDCAQAPANTPPTVSVGGVTDGGSYEIGSVPTPTCAVTDAEDGSPSISPVITGTLSHGLGTLTATCSYTDTGGLSDSDSATYTIVDTGDPTIGHTVSPTSPDGSGGWYVTAPTVTFNCADVGGSGVQSCLADDANPASDSITLGQGASQVVGGTATDWAGNTATDSVTLSVDLTDPYNITWTGGPDAGGTYYFGSVPAAPTCNATDDVSGLASCNVTGYSSAIGTHTLTATATDNAGRTATDTRQYTVAHWTFSGFYQPVDMNGVVNTIKGGSTVPIKFELFAGPTELTDTADVVTPLKYQTINCGSSAILDTVETVATGATSLRYDSTAGQFIYNWQTPKTGGVCYSVTITALDGSSKTALFKTK